MLDQVSFTAARTRTRPLYTPIRQPVRATTRNSRMRTVNMMPLPREMPGSRRSIRAERAPRRLPGRIRRPGSRAGPAKAARGASAGAHPQREVDAGNLVALPEVTDVACHPALRPVLVASLECLEQTPVSRGDARARLRHLVDHDAQRGLEQLQQRLLRQSQHRIVSRLPEAAEHPRAAPHRLLGISAAGAD